MRARYYSNSKIADFIRGTTKPFALEMDAWDEWHKSAKENHPTRYWIVEEGFDYLQNFVNYIPDKINAVRYYLNNRFYTKTHALTSNLKKGQWHEFDERVLHCLFDEFINFIEVEKAWDHCAWSEEARNKYSVPLTRRKWWLRWFTEWRCAEAGLDHLRWEMTLTNEEYTHWLDTDWGKPTQQAISASEQYQLYDWWKNIRPKRPDPYDISGWSEYCDRNRGGNGYRSIFQDKSEEDRKESKRILDLLHKIEEDYDKEDEEMMNRLLKIRKGLWT